jgi:hypothetical protein
MKISRDRLTVVGVVALAAIAVLGWMREPEKHLLAVRGERAIFQPPQDTIGPAVIGELPDDPVPIERPEPRTHRLPAVSDHQNRQETLSATPPSSVDQRDTIRTARERPSEDDQVRTRAPEPEDGRQPSSMRHEEDQSAETPRVASAPVARSKDRSVGRSAAIIAGAAAAGAAIGGLSGGGKGAAIGAVSGGAGGYVYDRMTRSRLSPAPPDTIYPDSSGLSDDHSGFSLAQQFRTPRFCGR